MDGTILQFEDLKKEGYSFTEENFFILEESKFQCARCLRYKNTNAPKYSKIFTKSQTHTIEIIDFSIYWLNRDDYWFIKLNSLEEARDLYESITGLKVIEKIGVVV